jgi:hypothetical protein
MRMAKAALGLRVEFDASRNLVNMMIGNECVDQMKLAEFRDLFGLDALRELIGGERRHSARAKLDDVIDPRD